MSNYSIEVKGIGKLYRLGARERYETFRDKFTEALTAPLRRLRRRNAAAESGEDSLWALRNVSFEVNRGEVLGVIGGNGAGKSTLLKLLSRITEPTTGTALIHGRVGSLLEVGTGFHPELSGRENIFLNGAILGMRRAEINRKFDEIVSFAEIERFLDTPVKRYSSGMYMRLAFAVAAHLDPEILLVDEVLAVGDARFQKKCLDKMGEITHQGRTVLFVSHNLTATATLCRNALWLQNGEVVKIGPALDVIASYLRPEGGANTFDSTRFPDEPDFSLTGASVSQNENYEGPFDTAEPVEIVLTYEIKRPVTGLRVGIDLLTSDGVTLWRSFDDDLVASAGHRRPPGAYRAVCSLPGNMFFPRRYVISLSAGIHATRWITFGRLQQTIEFYNATGVNSAYADEQSRAGLLLPGLNWRTTETTIAQEQVAP